MRNKTQPKNNTMSEKQCPDIKQCTYPHCFCMPMRFAILNGASAGVFDAAEFDLYDAAQAAHNAAEEIWEKADLKDVEMSLNQAKNILFRYNSKIIPEVEQ